ncbi:hypothetical protein MRX96_012961 [Rhipicephalus microplus]
MDENCRSVLRKRHSAYIADGEGFNDVKGYRRSPPFAFLDDAVVGALGQCAVWDVHLAPPSDVNPGGAQPERRRPVAATASSTTRER